MEWTRGRTIGCGSSAAVSIAKDHSSGQVFAVKSAVLSQSEFLKREQRILSTIRCPQIVAYKGCDITSENGKLLYNLFMEYAPYGTLIDAICNRGGRLDESTIKGYTREIAMGLEYLHSNGTVHCDIKGHNILVTNDGVKIADLGCARLLDDVSSADLAISGTPVFMAPEVARGEQQGFPADVWALGCTVIEMATGRGPWPDVSDPVSALYRIGYSGDVPDIPSFMSKQGKDFLEKCLKREPKERWSASELLKHAFLEESIFVSKEVNSFESDSDTPTCVLDQGFWDAMEELETTTPNPTRKGSLSSPKERLRLLSEGSTTSSQVMTNWEWDENWVTVRSNSMKEPKMLNCSQDCDLFYENEPTNTGVKDKVLVGKDNDLVESNIEPTATGTSGIEARDSSNCTCNSRGDRLRIKDRGKKSGSLLAYKCNKDVSCGKVHFHIFSPCSILSFIISNYKKITFITLCE